MVANDEKFDKNLIGKIVAIVARDHSTCINIDKEDIEKIKIGVATIVAIGYVIHEDDEKIMLGSFFTMYNDEKRHYEIHSILKGDIIDKEILKSTKIA
jgi:hypothetical protein